MTKDHRGHGFADIGASALDYEMPCMDEKRMGISVEPSHFATLAHFPELEQDCGEELV